MLRYLHVFAIFVRNSLIREMSFKANFLLWLLVEILWFLGQVLFIEVLFSHVDHIGDWSKWQMVLLIATHQVIAQCFQALFYMNLTQLPELVRTGRLDVLLTLPLDAQFAVSTKHFGFDNVLNALLGLSFAVYALHRLEITPTLWQIAAYAICVLIGVSIHYSLLMALSTLCFWIVRAQGLVYGYFNLFNIGRYPDTIFKGVFRFIFQWIIPVILVANIPARILHQPATHPLSALSGIAQLLLAASGIGCLSRLLWNRALKRYGSASS